MPATKASRSPPANRKPGSPAASAASISVARSPITKLPCVLHRPVPHQIVDHAGARFSPVVVFQISGDRSIRVMRAISDVVDVSAVRGEFGAHPCMQHAQFLFAEKSVGDAGLIGEQKHEISGVVEAPDRFRRIRHPADAVLRAQITVVVVDDAIAVEERGRFGQAFRISVHDVAPVVDAASRITRSTIAATSEAGMSRMQQ